MAEAFILLHGARGSLLYAIESVNSTEINGLLIDSDRRHQVIDATKEASKCRQLEIEFIAVVVIVVPVVV